MIFFKYQRNKLSIEPSCFKERLKKTRKEKSNYIIMTNRIVQILRHRKTARGVYFKLLLENGSKEWLLLHHVLKEDSDLANNYLDVNPGLQEYHSSCYR